MGRHHTAESVCCCVLLGLCVLTAISPCPLLGQAVANQSPWQAWQFLMGDWVGEGGGTPGQGSGTFSFAADLQGRVLVRRNHSDYPASHDRPAFSHDDLMVIYQESAKAHKAVYFDNEGHVIQYTVEFPRDSNAVVFLSNITANTPRFRLTYEKKGENRVSIRFEFAPPGNPEAFAHYIDAVAHRK